MKVIKIHKLLVIDPYKIHTRSSSSDPMFSLRKRTSSKKVSFGAMRQRFTVVMFPAILKARSDGAEEAGILKYFSVRFQRLG